MLVCLFVLCIVQTKHNFIDFDNVWLVRVDHHSGGANIFESYFNISGKRPIIGCIVVSENQTVRFPFSFILTTALGIGSFSNPSAISISSVFLTLHLNLPICSVRESMEIMLTQT